MSIRWFHGLSAIATAVVLQSFGFDQMQLFGTAKIDLPLLLVVGIGFVARADEAALLGFVIGLSVDLFQFGPFGLHALVYCLAGWTLATTRVRMLQTGASFRTVQGAGAVVVVTVLTWLAGRIFGQDPPILRDWASRLAIAALLGAALVHPATRVARWMLSEGGTAPRPEGSGS